ncbi:hypothetical protein COL516b_011921 [Colletotrichum fioriniae]|nr:uncharacterized protein COL516b_011921 [Colletotrichum fioriniae]KAJ0296069.1 hypothetical protein COL516b_011921 [Colletotrichum fioriniae]
MSRQESDAAKKLSTEDDEPDDWDKRIFSTGCADCYFEKKDWRQCTAEMEHFKSCWKQQGNDRRTDAKDA